MGVGPFAKYGARDLSSIGTKTDPSQRYVLQPLVVRSRLTILHAAAKTGKSALVLSGALDAVQGRSVFGFAPQEAISVIYCDYEMTEDDIGERLIAMGCDQQPNLPGLLYLQPPLLEPLDTAEGGRRMLEVALAREADLVITDTGQRAIAGVENAADTYRDFYRYTGQPLKAAGVAVLLVDHSGKDGELRGSSAKADMADLVFKLTSVKDALRLKLTHQRLPWVPQTTILRRQDEPHLHFVADRPSESTQDLANLLDELNVPPNATVDEAQQTLHDAMGHGKRRTDLTEALRYRRSASAPSSTDEENSR